MLAHPLDCPCRAHRPSPPDPRAALEEAFPGARVCDDGPSLAMALVDGAVVVLSLDPDGAHASRYPFSGARPAVAAGRDPGEALAGLGLGVRRAA